MTLGLVELQLPYMHVFVGKHKQAYTEYLIIISFRITRTLFKLLFMRFKNTVCKWYFLLTQRILSDTEPTVTIPSVHLEQGVRSRR